MSVGNEHSFPRKKRIDQEAITEITDEFCQRASKRWNTRTWLGRWPLP